MLMQTQAHKAKLAGFRLRELMIGVAIVGILATFAATSYQRQVIQSHRTDARTALLDLAGREEKLFRTTNQYSAIPSVLGYGTATTYYNVLITTPDPLQPANPNSYTITATPIAGSPQAADTTCTSLTVNQL